MSVDEIADGLENSTPVPRLPELSAMMIMKNVWYEIEELKTAPSWNQSTGRSSRTLVKYPKLSVVLILMKAGTEMGKHHVDGPLSVYVIQGKIHLKILEGHPVSLSAGELLSLEGGLEYDVEAIEESAFLLTIAEDKNMP